MKIARQLGVAILLLVTGLTASAMTIQWEKSLLTISAPDLPGERVEIMYLEAFCRTGSTRRTWDKTTIPHETKLLEAAPDGQSLVLESSVADKVTVRHEIHVVADGVEFRLTVRNPTDEALDIDWAQPCMRVDRFTQRQQADYWPRCFIFTDHGLTMLDKIPRAEEAIYHGGQVYVPSSVNRNDVNPRPLSETVPVNGLIGCFSADNKRLLAMAWDHTQELFQGVITCIHSDFRVGGLKPGETKKLFGKVYLLPNDPKELLRAYQKDFPHWQRDIRGQAGNN